MNSMLRMRQYQQQAVRSASPELLILKLYDLGIASCHRGDRAKVRAVLVELVAALNFEQGGEIAERLSAIYEFCLTEISSGDLATIESLLNGLRVAWKEGVMARKAA
jgi:flagellar protein FliS